jgi:lysine/ornithine N-monooxygenase
MTKPKEQQHPSLNWWKKLRASTKIYLSEKNRKISYEGLSEEEIEEIYNKTYTLK